MAVAARTSGPSDDRVPCPLCGGLIHPIAGRCKHCKADVTSHRGARPAAAAALPPLAPGAPAAAPPGGGHEPSLQATMVDPAPRHAEPRAATPVSYATAAPADDARPILPPRPAEPPPTTATRSLWRNWPMIVIGVAVIAIVVAVVLMVWPHDRGASDGARRLPPPPAPERMDTNPLPQPAPGSKLPPPSGADPWSSRGAVPDDDPRADDQLADDPDAIAPDAIDPDMIDPADPRFDPFASPRPPARPRRGLGGGGRGGQFVNPFAGGGSFGNLGSAQFMFTMLGRLCERAQTCGGPVDQMCSLVDGFRPLPPVPSCAAAQRCLEAVDEVDVCGGSSSLQLDFTRVFATVQDCMDAMRC